MQVNFTISDDSKAKVIYYVGKGYSEILKSEADAGTRVATTFKSIEIEADEEIVIIV